MTTTGFELLDGDTREHPLRNTWPGCPYEIGVLWVRRRVDEGYEVLSADEFVVVTQEFLLRLTRIDPRVSAGWIEGIDVGQYLTFYGHDVTVRYRVIKREPGEFRWLLKRDWGVLPL